MRSEGPAGPGQVETSLAGHGDFHVGLGVDDEISREVDRDPFERAGEGEVVVVVVGC